MPPRKSARGALPTAPRNISAIRTAASFWCASSGCRRSRRSCAAQSRREFCVISNKSRCFISALATPADWSPRAKWSITGRASSGFSRLMKKPHMLRCAQSPRTNSCSCDVFVLVRISRSRFTDTFCARLVSEVFLTLLVSLLLLARSELFAAQAPVNWKSDWEATQRAAEKEGRLVIYGPPGADQQKLYTEVFQQAFPRIKVNYTPGRMSEVISRIMAEQRAGMRQADLVLRVTNSLLGTLKEKGFLQPIRPVLVLPEILDTAAWFKGKLWFADKEDKFVSMWRAVPYTAACVNTNLVKPNELKSYWDLLQPKWKGKIVSQDLRIGSARNQMYTVYSRKDLGPEYLKRLYGEMDVTLSPNLPQIADWVASGKFAIAIGGVDCDDLAAKGLPVVPIHFEGIAAVGAGTDPASWLASSPNHN